MKTFSDWSSEDQNEWLSTYDWQDDDASLMHNDDVCGDWDDYDNDESED